MQTENPMTSPASLVRVEIGIDANDVQRLADFWQAALGYRRGSGDGRPYLNLVPPPGSAGPIVFLQQVPEGKTAKNRLHLDLRSPDPQALVADLLRAGARRIGAPGSDGEAWWQQLADPEGNEFCVITELGTASAGPSPAQ